MMISVAGLLFSENRVLIGLRNNKGSMKNRWEFPGGKVENGESEEQALVREYLEEFGAHITVSNCVAATTFFHKDLNRVLKAYQIFTDEDVHEWPLNEHVELRWVALHEIEKMPFVDSDLKLLPEILEWKKN